MTALAISVASRANRRRLLGVLLLATLLASVPVAQASKGIVGSFGAPNGEGKERLDEPQSLAVNNGGAGGVDPGDVYVLDAGHESSAPSSNNRVVERSASGAFVRAFGYDVVASGPGDTGVNDKQTLSVDATGGTYTLSIAKRTLASFTAGSNVATGIYAPTSALHVGDKVTGGGGFPAGTTIIAVGSDTVTLSSNASATLSGELNATETTAPISYNATAAGLEAALEALPAIGAGNVGVSGGPGATAPLSVEFKGALAGDDVVELSPGSSALTGATHTATVTTAVEGGGFEICEGAAVCKAGSQSAAAGGMHKPTGIAVDQNTGNVYVGDANRNSGTNRVDVYSADGAFEGAFGWKVNATSPEEKLQFCTAATGCQGGSIGAEAGKIPRSTARLAVSPVDGHLYLAAAGNNRIDEFAPVLNPAKEVVGVSFVKAFGYDVVESGPDNVTPVDETQQLTVTATGGKYTLSFGGASTPPLSFNTGASSVFQALNALSSVKDAGGRIDVFAKGGGQFELVFGSEFKDEPVPQVTADSSQLTGGTASVSTLTEGVNVYERCDVAANPTDVCKAGLPGKHSGQFPAGEPAEVAVDSSGAIYALITQSNGYNPVARVSKFDPAASTAADFAPDLLTNSANGVSSTGARYPSPTEIAVDPTNDHLLVARQEGPEAFKFLEFDSTGGLLETAPAGGAVLKATGSGGLAVGVGGRFYFVSLSISLALPNVVDVFGAPPAPSVAIGPVTGVGTTTATFHGTVTPPPPGPEGESFVTNYHFEYSTNGVAWTPFPADDVEVGDGSGSGNPNSCPVENPPSCNVEQTATGLQPGADYQVRLVGSTGTEAASSPASFTTKPAPPSISGTVAEDVAETTAKITGYVNPNNDATSYHFEWGTGTGYGARIPAEFEGFVGSGGKAVKVSANLSGLKGASVYHFRLVASSSSGEAVGPDREFSTLNSAGLPDGRGYELVSPADKRPQGVVSTQFSKQLTFQPAGDGNAFLFPIYNGLSNSTVGGSVSYMAKRGPEGWQSTQMSPPSLMPRTIAAGALSLLPAQVEYLSDDFSCSFVETPDPLNGEVPTPDVENGVSNLFLRDADGAYTLISAIVPDNPNVGYAEPYGGYYILAGASPDCERVYFKTTYHLLPGASGLYEWDHGLLRDAGILPDGTVPSESRMGGRFQLPGGRIRATRLNSVSRDGTRFFFNAISDEGADAGKHAVFVREDGASVDVSQSTTATVDLSARYEIASSDASHVFFAANYGLTPESSSGPVEECPVSGAMSSSFRPCDIYDYEVDSGELTDISADPNPADPEGAVALGVVGVSDDGSYVYFAARGQLIPGKGHTYAENLDGGANIYLYHEGALSFVAALGKEDVSHGSDQAARGDAFSNLIGEEYTWTAQATPDGQHLLFTAKANVTGYDSGGAFELYRYSAQDGQTACVSCRRDGQPSIASGGYIPMPAAPQSELHYAQTMSDDGRRVFFITPDVLAPGAVGGNENVYEWEAGQVYALASLQSTTGAKMLEASPSGDDVFIVGIEQLAPQDFDFVADVYDIRAPHSPGEQIGFPVTEPSAQCEALAEQCQGDASPQPGAPAPPPSAGFSGPGNVTSPPHKKRHKRKKHHRKAHKRQQDKRANDNRGGAK